MERLAHNVQDLWRGVFADLYINADASSALHVTASRLKYKVSDVAERFDEDVLDFWRGVFADLY